MTLVIGLHEEGRSGNRCVHVSVKELATGIDGANKSAEQQITKHLKKMVRKELRELKDNGVSVRLI